uniref:SLC3A2_N domain-containing protein n=1 Tax=Steinernema glaseri TaxID=37863 RepID=A0A1I7YWG5_9BILA
MDCESSSMPSSECANTPKSYNLEATNYPTDRVGLTEEQLKVYRNDPFWRMIRYATFGAFWGIFAAMLGGAIAIIAIGRL